MAKLVAKDIESERVLREYPLKATVTSVGRVSGQDVFINNDSVSRRHAEIRCIDDQYFVFDLGSLNGIFINDRRVNKGILNDGDQVRIGKVPLVFSLEPCQTELDRRGGGVFSRFFSALQDTSTAFDGQFGRIFDFLSTGEEQVQNLEANILSKLRRRTERFENAYRQLTILYRASQWINSEIDLQRVLGNCLDLAVTTLKADRGAILLYSRESDELEIVLAKARDPIAKTLRRVEWLKGIARRVFETREAMVLSPEFSTQNSAALTSGPNQPSFICTPVLGREDDVKGVIFFDCLAEKKQSFNELDIDFLATFGAQLAMGLDRDSLIEQVVIKKEMEKEMGIAQDIQRKLIPDVVPTSDKFCLAGRSIPCKLVGGDWYDFFVGEGEQANTLSVIIADVSGKGIPAALVLSQTRSVIKLFSRAKVEPERVIAMLNEFLLEDFDGSMYVTLVYAILDFDSMILRYVNSGHEWPIIIHRGDDTLTFLDQSNKPCGLFEGETFNEVQIPIKPGDRIILPTDGIIDAEQPSGDKFGVEALNNSSLASRELSAPEALDKIFGDVLTFSEGTPQFDDMTLVVVDVT